MYICGMDISFILAHAKLMCQSSVGLRDAVVAVTVMECSMQGSALLGGINVLHSAFPQKADEELALQGMYIGRYGCTRIAEML